MLSPSLSSKNMDHSTVPTDDLLSFFFSSFDTSFYGQYTMVTPILDKIKNKHTNHSVREAEGKEFQLGN